VHVITSCTDRKRASVSSELRLRQLEQRQLKPRLTEWKRRIDESEIKSIAARELYAGEHWTRFIELLDNGAGDKTQVTGHVISAGYGLIPVSFPIKPYAATFALNSRDSVRPRSVEWSVPEWWAGLSNWKIADCEEERSLAAFGRATGDDPILITASHTYLHAIESDLAQLIQERPEGTVVVFSPEIPSSIACLEYATVTYDSRLQMQLGGSRIGLNIRALAYALEYSSEVSQAGLATPIATLMRELPEPSLPKRTPSTDEEVKEFVRQSLTGNPNAHHSPLLRAWRSKNRACEQGRFRDLFNATKEESENQLDLGIAQDMQG
jgi:hypothetical protein